MHSTLIIQILITEIQKHILIMSFQSNSRFYINLLDVFILTFLLQYLYIVISQFGVRIESSNHHSFFAHSALMHSLADPKWILRENLIRTRHTTTLSNQNGHSTFTVTSENHNDEIENGGGLDDNIDVEYRSFCVCRAGETALIRVKNCNTECDDGVEDECEYIGSGQWLWSGRSDVEPSQRSNFGLMV